MRKPRHPPLTIIPPATTASMAPPHQLGEVGQSLWDRLQSEYRIDDGAGRELLVQACLAADRAEELHAVIVKDGMTIETKIGMKAHPLIKDELAARAFVVKTLQKLGLNFEPVRPGPGRPSYPGWRG